MGKIWVRFLIAVAFIAGAITVPSAVGIERVCEESSPTSFVARREYKSQSFRKEKTIILWYLDQRQDCVAR